MGGEVNITEPKNYDPNETYKKGDVVKYQGWAGEFSYLVLTDILEPGTPGHDPTTHPVPLPPNYAEITEYYVQTNYYSKHDVVISWSGPQGQGTYYYNKDAPYVPGDNDLPYPDSSWTLLSSTQDFDYYFYNLMYQEGDIVKFFNGPGQEEVQYRSLTNSNMNNRPPASLGIHWELYTP